MDREPQKTNQLGELPLRVAYTESAEGAARAEPAVPAEEIQDSLNATV